MYHFFYKEKKDLEHCFNVDTSERLTEKEEKILRGILADGFILENIQKKSCFKNNEVVEIGPRLNVATAFSTNAVGICHACGLEKVVRIEKSRRYRILDGINRDEFIKKNHDKMTECVYAKTLESFETGIEPEKIFEVLLIEEGVDALKKINIDMGLGMDDWDINFYYNLFVNIIKKNPSNVECFQLGQANSEHSRHWFFKGKMVIDEIEMNETLLEIIFSTLEKNPENSLVAFKDNSSAIRGYDISTLIPNSPGKMSLYKKNDSTYHFIFTAETHNFPTGVAPFPGAETGGGGRIRDVEAIGKGGLVVAGTTGYCVGNLNIPNYDLPWEDKSFKYPSNLASSLKIEIDASNGASDYGNKFGEPVIQGFTRSFGMKLSSNERQEYLKPIMFTGGIGQMDGRHLEKDKPKKGMIIIQIGGPAYRIGMGGGSASSMIQGENASELDFNAVQRGDAEMEQKMNRIVRACVELGSRNPIVSIHDQGAGGPCNVVTEIVEPVGGKVDIRKIKVGDNTLSVLEIWGAEYQERNALLILPEEVDEFKAICKRERINCEILGEITESGRIELIDSFDNSVIVDLELEKILGKMPQKVFSDKKLKKKFKAIDYSDKLTMEDALIDVLKLLQVGSKRFLTNKVDRSVTGLIARQQCCGPLQLPVSDVAVIAQTHFNKTGAAISIGEQPIKMIIDSKAGARMSVGEALTNMVWARISNIKDIKCSGNWMWAAKLEGEATRMYDAAIATRDLMIDLGIAIDGGKDSLSMAAKIGGEIVKSPGELAISAYASMPDITKVITPNIKKVGMSELWFIDLGDNKNRLGGSAFAQTLNQIGNESPDIVNPKNLKNSFNAIQEMIDNNIILSGHDKSDGGLITTILEMAFSGNCGFDIDCKNKSADAISFYFNEELGLVIEVSEDKINELNSVLKKYDIDNIAYRLGRTTKDKIIKIKYNNAEILNRDMRELRQIWEETSYQLEKLQMNPKSANEEKKNIFDLKNPAYKLSFTPKSTSTEILESNKKPKIAVIREEGSNGDREMVSAFYSVGFEVWDATMSDILAGVVDLDDYRGIVFVGGFSYADVLGSAKGWASTIKYNKKAKEMFKKFYNRTDTFSLGVCNGCQLMGLLGIVPWSGIENEKQPRFIHNDSDRFESRWTTVKILESPAMMFKDMAGSVFGAWVAHGEGRLDFPDINILKDVKDKNLATIAYVDDNGERTEKYPFNPNGSVEGITGLCSEDGRHLAMMPHPERSFLKWQWPWMPDEFNKKWEVSPWLKMFQNAREWCDLN
ncbi:phosphoribosylformylglycinamidine synthase [Candidatus Parcubacteria bacterium]|nr:phosphoribosylformylglycinamidine synthase [Candidatus Parcubacteria bacterium]